jgi:hypothetical protein
MIGRLCLAGFILVAHVESGVAQISGNISGNVSGRPSQRLAPNTSGGGVGSGSGTRYVPTPSGGLVSRDEGSNAGWIRDDAGGLVGTGANAGRRCNPAGAGTYRCN